MSFNRNLKRVAGPSFVVNVRYDDHHMMRCRNNTNVHPMLAKGRRLNEIYDVKEQEFLVSYKAEKGARYMDGYTHCFSSANNFSIKKPDDKANLSDMSIAEVKEAILKDVVFVGVASTEFIPTTAYQEQGFVAQVGGITTVMNESHDTIYPGDKVMLDVSLRTSGVRSKAISQKGIPQEKIRFTIKRAATSAELVRQAEVNAGGGGAAAIVKEYQNLQERVVGKSFSYARHGDRLEINLQPRSSY